jgi:hypothetical protein
MINFAAVRTERISRLEKRISRLSEKLKERYSAQDLSQFLKLEKEIEIQKAYKQLEQNNG